MKSAFFLVKSQVNHLWITGKFTQESNSIVIVVSFYFWNDYIIWKKPIYPFKNHHINPYLRSHDAWVPLRSSSAPSSRNSRTSESFTSPPDVHMDIIGCKGPCDGYFYGRCWLVYEIAKWWLVYFHTSIELIWWYHTGWYHRILWLLLIMVSI